MERFSCMVALMAPMALCACLRPLLPPLLLPTTLPYSSSLPPLTPLPQFSFSPPKGLLPLPFFCLCTVWRRERGSGLSFWNAACLCGRGGGGGLGRGKSAADGCVFFSSSFFLTLYAVPRALRGKRRVDYKGGRRRRRRRQERKKVGSTVHYTTLPLRPSAPSSPCKKETSKIA